MNRNKKNIFRILILLLLLGAVGCGFASCSETEDKWDPYYNWEKRNAEWFLQVADSARTAINTAQALYGNDWKDHCEWRMYKNLAQSASTRGPVTDSICVRIVTRGTGTVSPTASDSVRVDFRAWIMPTEYRKDDGTIQMKQAIFTQTYYGPFDEQTAAPQVFAAAGNLIDGFSTALQYMVVGDDWMIYIPQQLGYKEKASDAIPAYSTLLYRMHLAAIYESGSGIPDWN